jgi:hypothetical protein
MNGTIFEKKTLLNIKCVFWFSVQLLSENSYSKTNYVRYDQKFVLVFTQTTSYSRQILIKYEFPNLFLKKILKYQMS